jgi:hypothetical protein
LLALYRHCNFEARVPLERKVRDREQFEWPREGY